MSTCELNGNEFVNKYFESKLNGITKFDAFAKEFHNDSDDKLTGNYLLRFRAICVRWLADTKTGQYWLEEGCSRFCHGKLCRAINQDRSQGSVFSNTDAIINDLKAEFLGAWKTLSVEKRQTLIEEIEKKERETKETVIVPPEINIIDIARAVSINKNTAETISHLFAGFKISAQLKKDLCKLLESTQKEISRINNLLRVQITNETGNFPQIKSTAQQNSAPSSPRKCSVRHDNLNRTVLRRQSTSPAKSTPTCTKMRQHNSSPELFTGITCKS